MSADGTGSSGTGELGELEGSEGEVAVGERLTGNASCRTVDDSLDITQFLSVLHALRGVKCT